MKFHEEHNQLPVESHWVLKSFIHWFIESKMYLFSYPAIRTQAQHTPEMRIETSNQKVPRLPHDQLLVRNTDVKPISVMSPFVTSPMIAMATQPTILWLPYPSPPSSPTEQDSQTADSVSKLSITYTGNQSRSMYKTGESLSLASHDGVMLPVWRPWWFQWDWTDYYYYHYFFLRKTRDKRYNCFKTFWKYIVNVPQEEGFLPKPTRNKCFQDRNSHMSRKPQKKVRIRNCLKLIDKFVKI